MLPSRYASAIRTHGTIAAVLAVALALRVHALISLKGSLYADYLVSDEKTYHQWALKILSGDLFTYRVLDFAPLPAYFMAAVYKIFSPDPNAYRYVNIFLGVLLCWLAYRIGNEIWTKTIGTIAAAIAAVYKPFIFFSITALKTPLALVLFAAAIYCFLVGLRSRRAWLFVSGSLLGLLINVRGNSLLIPVFLVAYLLWPMKGRNRDWRAPAKAAAGFTAGLCVILSIFGVRNWVASHQVTAIPTWGFNYHLVNTPGNPTPYYRPVRFVTPNPATQALQYTLQAQKETSRRIPPDKASRYFFVKTIRSAWTDPAAFLKKHWHKALSIASAYEAADNYQIQFLKSHISFLALPLPTAALIIPLGLTVWVAARNRWRQGILAGVFLSYGVTLLIFCSNIRFRAPLMLLLILAGAVALNHAAGYIQQRKFRQLGIGVILFVVFYLGAHISFPGHGDDTGHINRHASLLYRNGRTNQAVAQWQVSSNLGGGYSCVADLALAGHYLKQRNHALAEAHLDRIPDLSFCGTMKYELTGDLHWQQSEMDLSVEAYRNAIEINGSLLRIHRKLALALETTGKSGNAADTRKQIVDLERFYKQFGVVQ